MTSTWITLTHDDTHEPVHIRMDAIVAVVARTAGAFTRNGERTPERPYTSILLSNGENIDVREKADQVFAPFVRETR